MNIEHEQRSKGYYIMHYGALLGVFWMIKYLFTFGEDSSVFFVMIFQLLNILTPILLYIFYMNYLKANPTLIPTMWKCIVFILGVSFLGAIFESALIFFRFAFWSPDSPAFAKMIEMIHDYVNNFEYPTNYSEEQKEVMTNTMNSLLRPRSILTIFIVSNILIKLSVSFLFAILIGFLSKRNILRK